MDNKILYIDFDREKRNTAGAKAPADIAELCSRRGYQKFLIPVFPSNRNKVIQKVWLATVGVYWWKRLEKIVNKNDIVIYQHPIIYGKRISAIMIRKIKKKKKCKFVAIIHDLETLRGGIHGVVKQKRKTDKFGDTTLLMCFDAVICHNDAMKKYMMGLGFNEKKLFCLKLFDYLSNYIRPIPKKCTNPTIAIAGNLAIGKCAYIYDICTKNDNLNLTVNLYGINYEEGKNEDGRIKWHGSFNPEELPEKIICDFGLVWDGISVDSCTGNTGNYLRYNNPHKTSLYLSAGIPVIVWKESAMASFIETNKVGITVDNLHRLDTIISSISEDKYVEMCNNAKLIAKKIQNGMFFYDAIDAVQAKFGED